MKFIILGTLAALLCFYAHTQDDNELQRQDIDLELEEELLDPPQNINTIQPNQDNPELPAPQPAQQQPVTAEIARQELLIVQDIGAEKEKRRSESAPKDKNISNSPKEIQNEKEQRRTSMSQQPNQNKVNGKKTEPRMKVNVKTPAEQPKPQMKLNPELKNKQKFKSKAPKPAKEQFTRPTNKNPPPQQQHRSKTYPKKDKAKKWYSPVLQ